MKRKGNSKEGRKNQCRDGLPAEDCEGAGQGHMFPDTTSGGGSPRVSSLLKSEWGCIVWVIRANE